MQLDYRLQNFSDRLIVVKMAEISRRAQAHGLTEIRIQTVSTASNFRIQLTWAWNSGAWKQYLEYTLPTYSVFAADEIHLLLAYSLIRPDRARLTADISVHMASHFLYILHNQPTSLTLNWRAVGSLQVLPI